MMIADFEFENIFFWYDTIAFISFKKRIQEIQLLIFVILILFYDINF